MTIARDRATEQILRALRRVQGIADAKLFSREHVPKVLAIEKESEERSLMGLGKVVNAGVREVLGCEVIAVALTNMEFDWGFHANLVMKKDGETVGEEVRDPKLLAQLAGRKDVWFLHTNFVVYKDKVSFPQDLLRKNCRFEIPGIAAEWCVVEDGPAPCRSIRYANPSVPCDLFLKQHYFQARDEEGLGTILVGARL